ncbi:MAG: hypothetical protein EOP10_35195, partial [Proteobacteria bacterium]
MTDRIKHLAEKRSDRDWQNHHPLVQKLDELKHRILSANMLESVDMLLHEGGLLDRVMQWTGDELDRSERLRSIELLRAFAAAFDQEAGTRGHLGLHQEFVLRIEAAENSSRTPFGNRGSKEDKIQIKGEMPGSSDALSVLTYHAAKGLEYPLVIMLGLDSEFNFKEFGVHVECNEGAFDWTNPLANQSLRFWPWPFGKKKKSTLEAIFAKSQTFEKIQARGRERLTQEAKNLLYVGVTRARDYLVLIHPDKVEEKKEAKAVSANEPKKTASKAKPKAEKPAKAIPKDESSPSFGEWAAAAEVPWEYHVVNDEALLTIGDLGFPCMSLQDLVA